MDFTSIQACWAGLWTLGWSVETKEEGGNEETVEVEVEVKSFPDASPWLG